MRRDYKREKRTKLRNKRLVKQYPWLRPIKWCRNSLREERDYKYDLRYLETLRDYPGWWRAFGKMFYDEIQKEYETGSVPMLHVEEMKEKWGEFRILFGNGNERIQSICDKYEFLSSNICYFCGRPNTCMTNIGWMLPICKKCYEKNKNNKKPYEEVTCDDGKLAMSITWRRYDKDGPHNEAIDISDTTKKIIEGWKE